MTVVPRPSTVSPVNRASSAASSRHTESAEWPGVATTRSSHPAAVTTSPSASPSGPSRRAGSAACTGAPVSSASRAAPAEWSGCPCVSTIFATRRSPATASACTRRRCPSSSGPGSTTTTAGRARLGDHPGVGTLKRHRRGVGGQQAGRPRRAELVNPWGRQAHSSSVQLTASPGRSWTAGGMASRAWPSSTITLGSRGVMTGRQARMPVMS